MVHSVRSDYTDWDDDMTMVVDRAAAEERLAAIAARIMRKKADLDTEIAARNAVIREIGTGVDGMPLRRIAAIAQMSHQNVKTILDGGKRRHT